MAQRCAVPTRQDCPPWSGPRDATDTAGAFLCPAPLPCGARHGGRKSAGTKGAQGRKSVERFSRRNPEGGQAKPDRAFGAYLARTAADATLPPLRALSESFAFLGAGERHW